MSLLAVIDTNVLVSSLITKNANAATSMVIDAVYDRKVLPILHSGILLEYEEVLYRDKFRFEAETVENLIDVFKEHSIRCKRQHTTIALPDEKDRIFLEAALAARKKYGSAYLVTGNKKHFPAEPFILSPAELLSVLSAAR